MHVKIGGKHQYWVTKMPSSGLLINVKNKNVFSTNSSYSHDEKYKEWKSSVCHGFVIDLIDRLLREIVNSSFSIQLVYLLKVNFDMKTNCFYWCNIIFNSLWSTIIN